MPSLFRFRMLPADKRAKSRKLGFAEYSLPGDQSSVVWDLRQEFFEKIETLAPEVLTTLYEEVRPYYRKPQGWAREDSDSGLDPWELLQARALEITQRTDTEVLSLDDQDAEFKDRLESWASRFHLRDNWILAAAVRTIQIWSLETASMAWAYPMPAKSSPVSAEERFFIFEHPGWDVEGATRQQAAAEICQAFDMKLASYLERMEWLATERGLERSIEKRSQRAELLLDTEGEPGEAEGYRPRKDPDALRHVTWLVKWQVWGLTHKQISKSAKVTEKTVAAGIRNVAEQMGLTRRSLLGR